MLANFDLIVQQFFLIFIFCWKIEIIDSTLTVLRNRVHRRHWFDLHHVFHFEIKVFLLILISLEKTRVAVAVVIANPVWCEIWFGLHIVAQIRFRCYGCHVDNWKRLLSIFRERLLLKGGEWMCFVWYYWRLAFLASLTIEVIQIIGSRMVHLRVQRIDVVLWLHVLLHLEWIEIDKAIALFVLRLQIGQRLLGHWVDNGRRWHRVCSV